MWQSVKYSIANRAGMAIVFVIRRLSRRQRRAFGLWAASVIFRFAGKTRRRAMTNIAAALPSLEPADVERMALQSYGNIVHGVLECFCLGELEFELSADPATRALLESGEGVSIATMHMGCYEAVPFALQSLTRRSTTISNIPPFIRFAQQLYGEAGIDCVNKRESGRFLHLLNAIRQQRIVSLHADHYGQDIEVDFFNQKTGAPSGAAMLSAFGQAPLLLSYATLTPEGKYRVVVETISQDPVGPSKPELKAAMQRIYQRFEEVILQYPDQWYWSYNRWRQPQ